MAYADKARTRAYACWHNMLQRCTNPDAKDWKRYGGRGVTVCERWCNSFNDFVADMGDPAPGMSIDRIDNLAGYEPSNCRWATRSEQQRNRRGNVFVVVNGERMVLSAALDRIGMHFMTYYHRVHKGMSPQEAIDTPVDTRFGPKINRVKEN